MDINSIVKTTGVTREFECELVPGFTVLLGHVTKRDMLAIQQKAEIMRFDPGTRTRRVDQDQVIFIREFCKVAIRGWRGLTVAGLSRFIPVETGADVTAEMPIEYNEANATFLASNSTDFDAWVTSIVLNPQLFSRFDPEDTEKNSSGSSKSNAVTFEEPDQVPGQLLV